MLISQPLFFHTFLDLGIWFVKWSTVPPNVGLGLFLFVFVFFIWFWASLHWLDFFMLRILDPLDFFMPPSFAWAPSMIENFLLCPLVLSGHFQSLRTFSCPPRVIWALSIIKDFLHLPPSIVWALSIIKDFFGTCPPSVGCDPSQCYFKKNALGSKGDFKGYILALWKDYQRWPFFISNACI